MAKSPFVSMKLGGQFPPKRGGQFQPKQGGYFKSK